MKVGYAQINTIFGEKQKNFEQVESLLADMNANLIVLPELFATGYTFTSKEEAYELSETTEGETAKFLISLAKKTNSTIVAGFIEREENKIYNAALIVDKKSLMGTYRKIHLYFKEKLWFSPGNRDLEIFVVNNVKIGIMICFDWFFPEIMRSLAVLGADIVAHPANLVLPYCQKAMITRCLENRVFAITANRIGEEIRGVDNFKFTGGSQITSYDGEILSSAPTDKNSTGFFQIDVSKARNKNLNEYNNLIKDRRKEFYL
ncbi:MAG: nitrilase-related carbon-nitrogen hydrolase [Candidatus Lokiarchaeota archaeon]